MSSYGYQNKYKTVAWISDGRLDSDYMGGFEQHDENVFKSTPTITYTEGGEEYYPQVAYSWHEDEFNINFKKRGIKLVIVDAWEDPEVDENGRYSDKDLIDKHVVEVVEIDKEKNSIRKYKSVLDKEEIVTDVKEKIKYGLTVDVKEAVLYWIEQAKSKNVIYIAGYYNDINIFVPLNTFGYCGNQTDEYISKVIKGSYSDCKKVIIVRPDST